MSTTDLQRLRQDEWLADLLSTEDEQGHGLAAARHAPFCALGRLAQASRLVTWTDAVEWLGISETLLEAVWLLNDGDILHLRFADPSSRSFAEIAGWFKEQRDLWDGDLSNWTPSQ